MSIIRADSIKNRAGNGAPTAPNGLVVSGVCSATSFVGSGTALTGIDAATLQFGGVTKAQASATGVTVTGNLGVSGVLTYEDVTNVDSVGIVTARGGIRVGTGGTVGPVGSGIVTYFGDGSQLSGIEVGIATEASTVTDGNTLVLNLAKDDHKVLASGVVTIDVTGGVEADSHTIRIENVGIATVGFATHFKFPSGGTPNLPTASGSISLISFTVHKVGASGTTLLAGASVNFS